MGRHLQIDRWYDRMPSTKNLRMKRVSAAREVQFPRKYRVILGQRDGIIALVKQVQVDYKCSLADAWAKIKHMVND